MALSKEKKVKIPKKNKKGDLPTTAEGWVRYVNEAHNNGLNARRKYEFQWVLNFAYLKGYQNLVFDRRRATIQIPKTMERPLTINRIGSWVDGRVAKLTRNRPIPNPIPSTNDPDDIAGAKYSGFLLDHLWRSLEMEDEYENLIVHFLTTGTSFMKTVWDPHAGDMIKEAKTNENQELFLDANGEVEFEKVWLGEIHSRAKSSFQIIPGDECIREVKDQPWMIERDWLTIATAEKYFPHLKGKFSNKAKDQTDYEKIIDRLASPISSAIGSSLHQMYDSHNSEVLIKTMWIKPNQEYEQGLVVSVIGDELAYIDVWPNDYGKNVYPFVKFSERSDGYHFWGQSTMERLLSIQKAYNRLKQKKLKNAYLMGNGKYLLAKGSQVIESAITDEEGEVIEFNPSVPAPRQMEIAPLPNYVVQLANELILDFRDSGGQPESSFSPNPNLTAAVALEVSAEIGDQMLTPILRRLARGMQKVAQQQLILANEEYTEPRKILILGNDGFMGVQFMSGVDFRHCIDVHIDVESMFPDFRGSKTQRLFDLWDRRIIQDPKMFLKALRFGNFDSILEDIENIEEPVVLEIAEIKRGNQPEINQFQDHFTHFKVLSDWIKSPEFLRLPPERKDLAVGVLQEHMQFLTQSMPNQGAVTPNLNQNSVGSPFGQINPVGQPGNQAF
jgi:hypothetical protein